MVLVTADAAVDQAVAPERCPGCYRGIGRTEECYRFHWQRPPCECGRCVAKRSNAALEDDPGDMGEPPIATQRQEAARQGQLRQVINGETLVVCDYDERRPKHSRCGDRLTEACRWYPGDAAEAGVPADALPTLCGACDRRTALEGAGTKVQPCTSCGALMYWGIGARGGRLPLSVKTGVSHFADCPNAAKHSKKRSA